MLFSSLKQSSPTGEVALSPPPSLQLLWGVVEIFFEAVRVHSFNNAQFGAVALNDLQSNTFVTAFRSPSVSIRTSSINSSRWWNSGGPCHHSSYTVLNYNEARQNNHRICTNGQIVI